MKSEIANKLREKVDGEIRDLLMGTGRFAPDPYPDLTRDMASIGYKWDVWRKDWIDRQGVGLVTGAARYSRP